MESKSHLVLGDAGLDFWVADFVKAALVELAKGIEHFSPFFGGETVRILQIKHGIAGSAEGYSGEAGGEKAAPPHSGEKSLAIASLGELRGETNEGG